MKIEVPKTLIKNEDLSISNIYQILLNDGIIDKSIAFDEIDWQYIEEKMQGVILNKDGEKQIVIFTPYIKGVDKTKTFKSEGRNTFLLQNFITCYKYAKGHDISDISYSLNFDNIADLKNEENDKSKLLTDSLFFNLREFATLGVSINNSLRDFLRDRTIFGFTNFQDFLDSKYILKNSKKNNNSLKWTIDDENKIFHVYSKNTGATRGEVLLFLLIMEKFLKDTYKIEFISLEGRDSNSLINMFDANENIQFKNINDLNKDISKNLINELINNPSNYKETETILKRSQEVFKDNIINTYFNLEDFNISRCFCCNYILGESLIRSHIHRFSDISKDLMDKKISINEAVNLNISGLNGFLLCPNHDKMFERGEIVFNLDYLDSDEKDGPFIVNKNNNYVASDKTVSEFIKNSISNHPKMFEKVIKNKDFIKNVLNHQKRVNYSN